MIEVQMAKNNNNKKTIHFNQMCNVQVLFEFLCWLYLLRTKNREKEKKRFTYIQLNLVNPNCKLNVNIVWRNIDLKSQENNK